MIDAQITVLKILEESENGMIRSEIFDHPLCELCADIEDISKALNQLQKKGLIRKGKREGKDGHRWHFIASEMPIDPDHESDQNESATIDDRLDQELKALAAQIDVRELAIDMPETKIHTLRKLAPLMSGTIGSILNAVANDIERIAID